MGIYLFKISLSLRSLLKMFKERTACKIFKKKKMILSKLLKN